jgi:hypothetical protein
MRMANEAATSEEDILFLLHELDRALRRRTPEWPPDRAKIAKRLATTVALKLAEMAHDL